MMQKIIPTQLSNWLQVANYVGVPFEKIPNTTMNQKFDILPNAPIPQNAYPTLSFFTIGIGGHSYIQGTKGIPLSQGVDHQSSDFGLYQHLPFVIRALDNDLTTEQRRRFCLRAIVADEDGVNRIRYYGRRLDKTGVVPKMTKRTVKDGQTEVEDFVPTEANLSPVPPEIPSTGVVTTSGVYLATSCVVPMPFTEWDVNELYNVAKILYGDERYAVISEFGFCTAIDQEITINTPGGAVRFNEVIGAQLSAIISGHYELIYNSKGFDFSLEVGAVQPLLGTDVRSTVSLKMTGTITTANGTTVNVNSTSQA